MRPLDHCASANPVALAGPGALEELCYNPEDYPLGDK